MPCTEILRVRNCIHVTATLSKSVSLKILGLKLVKRSCIIIYFDLDTIKKARNELDRACSLALVNV